MDGQDTYQQLKIAKQKFEIARGRAYINGQAKFDSSIQACQSLINTYEVFKTYRPEQISFANKLIKDSKMLV